MKTSFENAALNTLVSVLYNASSLILIVLGISFKTTWLKLELVIFAQVAHAIRIN